MKKTLMILLLVLMATFSIVETSWWNIYFYLFFKDLNRKPYHLKFIDEGITLGLLIPESPKTCDLYLNPTCKFWIEQNYSTKTYFAANVHMVSYMW